MIIGVDVGTTMTKAAVFDRNGRTIFEEDAPSRLNRLTGARVEQDLDDVVGTVATVVGRVAARLPGPPAAIALTGQGDGLWLRNADGSATRPPISWLDGRAAEQVRRWRREGVVGEVFRRTGSGLFPGAQGPLLAALDETEPEALREAAVAGYCVDAIVQRLTGEITVDASDASLPFLDPRTRSYDREAMAACGVGHLAGLLAEPARPGTLFTLDDRGARLLGLPAGTPVSGGPFDLPASLIGSGLTEPGDGLLTVGTTLACQVLTGDVAIDPDGEPAGMWLCMPEPDRYSRAMPAMVGTASLDWLLDLLQLGIDALGPLLTASPPGANGISVLPFLAESGERAPFLEPQARGQLTGVHLGSTRADVVRAVCESLAYAARHCFEAAGLTGRLAICGGGMKSGPWTQVFADVLNRPVILPTDNAIGVRGATAAAWQSLGDPLDVRKWLAQGTEIHPDPRHRTCYEEGYARYRDHLDEARRRWARAR